MFHFQNLRVFSMIRLPSMIFDSRPLSRSFWVWGLRFVGLAQRFFSSECLRLHASLKPLLSVGVRFLRIILLKTFKPSDPQTSVLYPRSLDCAFPPFTVNPVSEDLHTWMIEHVARHVERSHARSQKR